MVRGSRSYYGVQNPIDTADHHVNVNPVKFGRKQDNKTTPTIREKSKKQEEKERTRSRMQRLGQKQTSRNSYI